MAAITPLMRRSLAGAGAASSQRPLLLLFAHAAGMCKEVWGPVWDDLEKLHSECGVTQPFELLAFDLYGHGEHDGADLPVTAKGSFMPQIRSLLDAEVGPDKACAAAVGIGHSMVRSLRLF
eukprot:PLAT213.7.p2 GENE.PLAT213.7~~PLAT213.7.p2  ORF type:complete len:121 (+),score=18.69 PLAT213.7:92-454(+)